MQKKLYFENKLIEGSIIKRPNRFLMEVLVNEEVKICHCPCTGKIGNIIFDTPIPCLLSLDKNNTKRKTEYTVEAISLNNIEEKHKNWIGINQTKANRYIEYFLRNNQLKNMVDCDFNSEILREKVVGSSKLDFLVDNCFLEVKTPLVNLQLKDHYFTNKKIKIVDKNDFNSTDRFLKHIYELSNSLEEHQKAYLITFLMFDAEIFTPTKTKKYEAVYKSVKDVEKNGMELWQVNAIFESDGITLKDYFKMNI